MGQEMQQEHIGRTGSDSQPKQNPKPHLEARRARVTLGRDLHLKLSLPSS